MSAPAARPQLHDHQTETLVRIQASIEAGKRRIIMVSPTGSGKTVTVAEFIARAINDGQQVLFITHRRELTRQASNKLSSVAVDHGIIQAGFPSHSGARVQVASIQTLDVRAMRSRTMELPRADLIIVDECHHARARTWQRVLAAYPKAIIIGLTATPCRADGRGLGNIFDELIETVTAADLIALGFLVPTRVYAPVTPDLTGVQVRHGDYVEGQLAERMNTTKLVGDVIEHWHRIAERCPTVVFAVNVAHSVSLRDEFRRSGVLAEHIDGSTPSDERDDILARLASGAVEVVCNCAVLTEGWDCPEVSCIVLARPTKSLGLYRQMVGRTLRPAPGKKYALVLDHAGNVFAHGFAEDPIEWTLSTDQRAENKVHNARGTHKMPELTRCPECSAVRYEGKPCPVCGWRPVPKPKPVDLVDGELGRVDPNGRHVQAPILDELGFYRELKAILAEKRWRNPAIKDGWVAVKFKERAGKWPPHSWRDEQPKPPTPAVRAWVRSRDIAFARAMDKARAPA